MFRYLSKSILLLLFSVTIRCVIYPCVVWVIGQVFFPFQANGSLLTGPDGSVVGHSTCRGVDPSVRRSHRRRSRC